jgi:hypothetical protein
MFVVTKVEAHKHIPDLLGVRRGLALNLDH